jgi:ornithine cyclodeaminase/alanine dehydrogenase-like protein (mu-crystallin family)
VGDRHDRARKRSHGRRPVESGVEAEPTTDLRAALLASDVCVTCTPARGAFVMAADVGPGTFIAAVGADAEGKQEIDPALVASSTLVVDVIEQCAVIGELQHALRAGLMRREDVHAELADVVSGRRPGRTRRDEITIFDSSGTALQDAAAAVAVYEKAHRLGRGTEIELDD